MGIHNILSKLANADHVIPDPGDAGTIAMIHDKAVCNITTGASGETRVVPRADREGLLFTASLDVDGGGDCTLTVTGGYNADADTTVVLGDAGDFVTFLSTKIGSYIYWRVLAQEGTNAAMEDLSVDTLTAATLGRGAAVTAEHGVGAVGTGGFCRTYRYTRDGSIITDIEVDLTGLDSSGTANDVIGLATGGAAYIGRNVVATNGIIYKVEVTCLEIPLTGDADILFVAGSEADEAFDATVANTQTIADGTGDWTLGETIVLTAPAAIAANYYYYMTQGASDDATYTAGQFLLRFYGKAVMSA